MGARAHTLQKQVSDALELQLQEIVSWEQTGPLQEQCVILTAKPSL